MSPKEEYLKREKKYNKRLKKQERRVNLLSNIRFIIFFLTLGITAYLIFTQELISSFGVFAIGLFVFIYMVVKHERLKKEKDITANLVDINSRSIARIEGKWTEFEDDGKEYINSEHPYAIDLDLFGPGSLFQWINVTNTFSGRQSLKNILMEPLKSITQIIKRQRGIEELAEKLDWRQNFQAMGRIISRKAKDPAPLIEWANKRNKFYQQGWFKVLIRILPVVTITFIVLAFLVSFIPFWLPLGLITLQFIINYYGKKEVNQTFNTTKGYKGVIERYQYLLMEIEEEVFESKYLKDLQQRLFNERGILASNQIEKLKKLTEMMDLRYNAGFYFIINTLFFWDYQQMVRLEKWKEESGQNLAHWLQTIASFEELSSLAIISFNNRDWTRPSFKKKDYHFEASELGHPLIYRGKRVCNDLSFRMSGNILIITGSNMSGKSTLLRTVGINLVLAYTGAPVCADQFNCSIMDIYSSMRVNDNLKQSISSFYAELLRIKMIVDASRKNKPMLFLIDEIFKGTNARDRHIGAERVIKKLSEQGVIGLVSTHDLELGELADEKGLKIDNYHFEESYEDEEMKFSYKLQPGVSTSTNALFLMKMVGID